ncbi:MAG: putative undecaprenyl-phosphate N-acetylglucosaminyl 1-phosphate transferase [Phycisphaerae bacterium]|nr:putative undecaprenyl-phosphate N-acetylglucosaminyl 1-phosphate transferase [Phycisphaerae bacterium]
MTTAATLLAAAVAAAYLISAPLTAVIIRIARRVGFVDHPGGHKSHREPTPYGGGVAIFAGVILPLLAALALVNVASHERLTALFGDAIADHVGGLKLRQSEALAILISTALMHLAGLIDDVRPLSALVKLLVTVAAALLVSLWGGVRIAQFAGFPLSVVLTIVWLCVTTHAFNFLDNMDGLSAGVAAIVAACLAACGLLAGQMLVPVLACLLLGAALGFLTFNFPPARIFMGDAGSLVLGYLLGVASTLTTYYESGAGRPPFALAMPLVVLAVPLYDAVSVVWIRISEGRSPMKGDQRHFSHRLVQHGLSRRGAVLTIYLATAATGLCATLLPHADARQTFTIAAIVGMVLTIIAILESPVRNEP